MGRKWKPLAVIFSVTIILGGLGTAAFAQPYTMSTAVQNSLGIPAWITTVAAAVICGSGGIIGIVIGCLGTRIAGKFLLQGMVLWPNQTITIGAFLFSVVLGVLFGLYPAVKASGLQPVEALRAE